MRPPSIAPARTSAFPRADVLDGAAAPTVDSRPVVLVVDDYDDTRHFLASLLGRAGFRIREAENGLSALESVQREPPDVVLMDLAMPDMDGIDALRLLRAHPRTARVPVVVLTGSAEAERRRAHEAGCAGFLVKPCAPATLVNVLRSVLPRAGAGG